VAGVQVCRSCSSPELSLLGKVTFPPKDGVSKRRANGGAVIGDLEAVKSVED
jgi:hypothetical protein